MGRICSPKKTRSIISLIISQIEQVRLIVLFFQINAKVQKDKGQVDEAVKTLQKAMALANQVSQSTLIQFFFCIIGLPLARIRWV